MLPPFPCPAYIRTLVSPPPSKPQGTAIVAEWEAARAWAKQHGLGLDESLSIADLGVSAFQGGTWPRRLAWVASLMR